MTTHSRLARVLALGLTAFLFACSDANQPKSGAAPAPAPVSATLTAAGFAGDVMRVHYIDMDQGNATLVEFKCAAILIDAGGEKESPPKLIKYLDDFFAKRPDLNRTLAAIYITHTHIDHNVSLDDVVKRYTVHNYIHTGVYDGHSGSGPANWMRNHANDNGRKIAQRAVDWEEIAKSPNRTGVSDDVIDPVKCAGSDPRIRVVHGQRDKKPADWTNDDFRDANNGSLVIRIDYGKSSFLFLGDIETPAIDMMVDFYGNTKTLEADVFLASHHGSANGTSSLMKAMAPQIGVISMGRADGRDGFTAWQHGHPRKVAVDLMVAGIKRSRSPPKTVRVAVGQREFVPMTISKALYATGWDGTVIVTADRNGKIEVGNDNSPIAAIERPAAEQVSLLRK